MEDILNAAVAYLRENWPKMAGGLFMMFVGWYFGKRKAMAEWKRREFYDRLNISLNSITDGTLKIRTILEKSCTEVFLNSIAVETINLAARTTTEQDPIVPLPKDDYWYYLNSVLNEVAEQYSQGEIRRDLGQPTARRSYLICLTSEQAGNIRTHKIRAQLIQKSVLLELPNEAPKFERDHHITRWKTLKFMQGEYAKNPHKFIEMEISV